MTVTLTTPVNPMAAQATVGKDYLVYVSGIISPATVESWNVLGGQQSGTIDETTDEIDVSNKASGGYKAALSGLTTWSIDFGSIALMPGSDNGVEILKRAKALKTQLKVKILYPDGSFRVGWASGTTYSVDTPYDKAATLKGKLVGYGALSVQSVVESISAAAAQTVYFMSTATATAISAFDMTTGVTTSLVAANFTTTPGSVTLTSTYIATLTAASEYLFYITLSTGGYALLPMITTT
jgi:predicted secreted protein